MTEKTDGRFHWRGVLVVLQCAAVLTLAAWGAQVWASSATWHATVTEKTTVTGKATGASDARVETTPEMPASAVPMPRAQAALSVAGSARPISARIDSAWLDTVSVRTDIPRPALAAYAGAASVLAEESPQCHLGWNTLAAIGHIESDDGRYGGAALGADGYPSVLIVGPALDGGAFAAIHTSDGGQWDGDAVWDHAVGPFQFIPQTWRSWGADGNGDGRADPNQIEDAALAAAHYLCHAGNLSSVEGWRRAVFSYNHLDSYVDDVARVANAVAAQARSGS